MQGLDHNHHHHIHHYKQSHHRCWQSQGREAWDTLSFFSMPVSRSRYSLISLSSSRWSSLWSSSSSPWPSSYFLRLYPGQFTLTFIRSIVIFILIFIYPIIITIPMGQSDFPCGAFSFSSFTSVYHRHHHHHGVTAWPKVVWTFFTSLASSSCSSSYSSSS